MVLEKTLESPLNCKETQPGHSKGDQPWVSLEGMMLKLKVQYFGHLMRRATSLEKTLMLKKIEGRRLKRQQRMVCLDSIIDSMDIGLSRLLEMVNYREPWCAAIRGVEESRTLLST